MLEDGQQAHSENKPGLGVVLGLSRGGSDSRSLKPRFPKADCAWGKLKTQSGSPPMSATFPS